MRRRVFALGLAGTVLPLGRRARGQTKAKTALVLGAGAAGLAAAQLLQEAGYEVIVCEAKGRLGGRIHTTKPWPDLPVDLGASWIHGRRGNPATAIACRSGLKMAPSPDSVLIHHADGRAFSAEELAHAEHLIGAMDAAVARFQQEQGEAPLEDVLASAQLLSSALCRMLAQSHYELEYAGRLAQLSAQWFDSGEEFGGGDALIIGGFSKLIDALARSLDIRTHFPVERVCYDKAGVEFSGPKGRLTARQAIITAPLGVLKAKGIRFLPELPQSHRQAIAALGCGTLEKLIVRLPDSFQWPAQAWLARVPAHAHEGLIEWFSLKAALGQPALVGFLMRATSKQFDGLRPDELKERVGKELQLILGKDCPPPEGIVRSKWASDPYARGSYSFYAVGSNPAHRRALARPISHVLALAGEACSVSHPGTVHGAILSGRAAAQALINSSVICH